MNIPSVLCVGSASRDIFFPLDEVKVLNTPEDLTAQKHLMLELGAKYRTDDRFESPGGCALNVSLSFARLGVRVAPYCVLGDDTYGEEIREELVSEGVDTRFLVRKQGVATDVSCILVDKKSADRTIVYNRDANEKLRVYSKDLLGTSDIFVSGLYGEWHKNAEVILEHMEAEGSKHLYYNPGQRNIADDIEMVSRMIAKSTVVLLNKDEATEIVFKRLGVGSAGSAQKEEWLVREIYDMGPRYVIVTDGNRGAWVYNGEVCYVARAKKVEHIIDTTGAGDAFSGAFLSAFIQKKDMAQCLRWGIANGASVVQHYGAKEGLLTAKEMSVASGEVRVEVI